VPKIDGSNMARGGRNARRAMDNEELAARMCEFHDDIRALKEINLRVEALLQELVKQGQGTGDMLQRSLGSLDRSLDSLEQAVAEGQQNTDSIFVAAMAGGRMSRGQQPTDAIRDAHSDLEAHKRDRG